MGWGWAGIEGSGAAGRERGLSISVSGLIDRPTQVLSDLAQFYPPRGGFYRDGDSESHLNSAILITA